jgi:uncharacterized protein YxjI
MRYLIREKILCLGDDFSIRDEDGRERFHFDGKAFTVFRERINIRDEHGDDVGFVRQKITLIRKAWEIHLHGNHVATVSKDILTLLRCSFTVDVPGPDDYEAQGGFLHHDYTYSRRGGVVATVSKKWLSIRDTYAVDIEPGQDDLLILASAVVIDQICHDEDENSAH